QGHDVNLGMAEQPEQVLPENRSCAIGRLVEMRPEEPVEGEKDEANGQRWECDQDEHDRNQHGPHEHGHSHVAHPARAHRDDGYEEVESAKYRRDAENEQSYYPEVQVQPRREVPLGEIRVAKPSCIRQAAPQPAQMKEERPDQENPE